ncbi:uncharacterized protein LOC100376261, partial [Saccoglossus kowalevskii]|uniref:Uncharacterized protein LOC100376261 n=1 Tax=Saccoglossus kowalevskii TaxID=10224 RepID=A0ABM0GNK1_SACKO
MSNQEMFNTEGYLHQVSKVKLASKNDTKYFNAVLQEQDGFKDIVVFSPQKHRDFINAEKHKSPVLLKNLLTSPSRRDATKNDLKYNSRSNLSIAKKLKFNFDSGYRLTRQSSTTLNTIRDITDNFAAFQTVNTVAKVISCGNGGPKQLSSGLIMQMQEFAIADSTSSMLIAIWGEQIDSIKLNSTYKFNDVSVREFQGTIQLTSTPDTTITETTPLTDVSTDNTPGMQMNTIRGTIISAECTAKYYCHCKKQLVDYAPEMSTIKCPYCSQRTKTSHLLPSIKAYINITSDSGKMHKLTASEVILQKLCPQHDLKRTDETEEILLDAEEQEFQVSGYNIISISPVNAHNDLPLVPAENYQNETEEILLDAEDQEFQVSGYNIISISPVDAHNDLPLVPAENYQSSPRYFNGLKHPLDAMHPCSSLEVMG